MGSPGHDHGEIVAEHKPSNDNPAHVQLEMAGQNEGRLEYGEPYEVQHVHEVYEEIAEHFSGTRYKPWPIVAHFLQSLPPGSVGLDVGCGNGKYLAVRNDIFILASDRSANLARIASHHAPHDALVADTLGLPHPRRTFDFAISIAVVHHLSTRERRVEALAHVFDTVKTSSGKVLVYVWALEQKDSRRGWDKGDEQDVLVPWVLKGRRNVGGPPSSDGQADAHGDKVYQRYYHLYREGELDEDIANAGGRVVEAGYEKDNWWAIATPRSHGDVQ